MFFELVDEIKQIASKTGTAIFVVPNDIEVEIKNAVVLQPENKSVITIEQVRDMICRINIRQTEYLCVVVRPADLMGDAAANAFLKSIEEPGDKVHFDLITDNPSKLLPTILSRAAVYFLRSQKTLSDIAAKSDKDKALAKRLLVAKPAELVDIAEEIAKKKDGVRSYALEILGLSIEMLYKSYFLTN